MKARAPRLRGTAGLLSYIATVIAATAATVLLSLAQALSPPELAVRFAQQVERRLDVPAAQVEAYGAMVEEAAAAARVTLAREHLLVVDRDEQVQAMLLLWREAPGQYFLVGAAPVSTGLPGSFDHFETPTGLFAHTPANPDFRAEGTLNSNGIRGYGEKGMRVFDFGWQPMPKGWGDGAVMDMRLQVHATDPDALERRLGTRQSKGCIRIPAAVNEFLDVHGLIDADYERAAASGRKPWVLREDREPAPGAGRWLVVVDSKRAERPAWSPRPWLPHRRTR